MVNRIIVLLPCCNKSPCISSKLSVEKILTTSEKEEIYTPTYQCHIQNGLLKVHMYSLKYGFLALQCYKWTVCFCLFVLRFYGPVNPMG